MSRVHGLGQVQVKCQVVRGGFVRMVRGLIKDVCGRRHIIGKCLGERLKCDFETTCIEQNNNKWALSGRWDESFIFLMIGGPTGGIFGGYGRFKDVKENSSVVLISQEWVGLGRWWSHGRFRPFGRSGAWM